ncbi:ABC transporter ATP-binding protein [Frankia sp. CNm7]|uniref:ABC transporter ATP-binding protein n=1 Tax=Frankia nepalensis TaxID=1836974 RepID=A0A937UWU8_9ACTN|nr:ABC transporter ATP-binding protein [Frankia nepalensis]MBL7513617.1 ABC transporter ATP-binding protein [Frankia nepalensis]MBL7523838.1 ABC transporter ATP-binding protein [Frankia nepalensis]MBL7633766.1 ABC transporter ATP-binding protein [Frankia nepalensis]
MLARHSPRALRTLFAHAGDGGRLLVGGYALILVDAVAQSLTPAVFRVALNRIQHDPHQFVRSGWQGPVVAAAAMAATFLTAAYLAHTWTRRGAARWATNLRRTLYEHVQRLSMDFFHRSRVGDIAALINQDIERLELAVWQGMVLWWAVALLVISVGLIAWVDLWMALLALGLLAVAVVWTLLVLPRLRRRGRDIRDELGRTSGTLAEMLGVNALLKAFNAEDDALGQVRRGTERVRAGSEALARLQHRYADPLGFHLAFVAPFLLLFIGSWRTASGTLSIGDVVAIWGFWLRGSSALTQVITTLPEVITGLAASERAAELLEERPAVADGPHAPALAVTDGRVAFEHVSFAYPGRASRPVLDGFDLTIRPGQTTALVGPSGAGKSTVAQLLLRFFDPVDGRVTIDGHDLRDVTQASVRAAVGVVFQDSVLLSGSLARNLRLARPTATDEEIEHALHEANAWEFVRTWDDGIHTELGERGVTLSGGQRQRLAIARVMLKDPAIVVLDEATSALDAASERLVLGALDRLLAGRTSLVIAHRVTTIRDADQIVVVERGRVGDIGTHASLLQSSATYRSYYREQAVA